MTTQITITLSDDVYERAKRLADISGHDLNDAVALTLADVLPPLPTVLDNRPLESLSDAELIKTADSMMDDTLAKRMSALLYKQQAEIKGLSETEQAELQILFEIYEIGQLRKAEAMVATVKRGLREPA